MQIDGMHPVQRDGRTIGFASTPEDAHLFAVADDLRDACQRVMGIGHGGEIDASGNLPITLPRDLWDDICAVVLHAWEV